MFILLSSYGGVAFGPLVTLFQDAVSRQVDKAKDIATSLQSSIFNFGIVVGSAILSNFSVYYIAPLSLGLLVISIIVSAFSKTTFLNHTKTIKHKLKKHMFQLFMTKNGELKQQVMYKAD